MRTKIECPDCGSELIIIGTDARGIPPSQTIELFCDTCVKLWFIRLSLLDDVLELERGKNGP